MRRLFLGIGTNQNKKLCNLHTLIINGWSIAIRKVIPSIIEANFIKWENEAKFDFYVKSYKLCSND